MNVTDGDRERAASLVPDHQHWCQVVGHGDCCARDASDCDCGAQESRDAVAEALADERERALRPVLELAADYDDGSEWGMATHPGHAIRERIRRAAGATE